jgi:DNA-binding response OmpR family regulator
MRDASVIELEAVVLSSDPELIQTISRRLRQADIEVATFNESAKAAKYIAKRKIDAVIVDSDVSGAMEFS